MLQIGKAAVLGAGTMGAAIAAHLSTRNRTKNSPNYSATPIPKCIAPNKTAAAWF
ncbi:MAG: hypothetical protein M3367_04765 [Acidobacteriota bacterium]|nr:hypothetical protein [Acidobacteriota bacterium]